MMTFRVVVAALATLASVPSAWSHAFLDHAAPAVGSTVHGSPTEVRLWFTQALEPAFSTLRVVDASGRQVDRMDKQLDARDRALLKVTLPALAPGTYRVLWRVLSVDTHVSEGDFKFDVVP
jgi:methionine-rich copper-binding protein CopC